jgi:hypothetical protein
MVTQVRARRDFDLPGLRSTDILIGPTDHQ